MLPTAHAAVTLILWVLLGKVFGYNPVSLVLVFVFGVLIDGDAIFLGSNHRASPIHSIATWLLAITIAFSIGWPYWWTITAALIHLAMDSIDYKVYLVYPFSKAMVGLALAGRTLNYEPGVDSLVKFARGYLGIRGFFVAEVVLVFLAVVVFMMNFDLVVSSLWGIFDIF